MELDRRPSVNTATRRFQNISAILRELNQAGLQMQTVNDLLTVYVGAASQHTLRTTFDPEAESFCFDSEIAACRSQLVDRDTSSSLFHWPLRISAVQRHAAVPWTAWSVIPTLMEITESSDTDSLFAATPVLPGQLLRLQSTTGCGPACPSRAENNRQSVPQAAHKRLLDSPVDNPSKNPSTLPCHKHRRPPPTTLQ